MDGLWLPAAGAGCCSAEIKRCCADPLSIKMACALVGGNCKYIQFPAEVKRLAWIF
jgi:hypothetical protein